MADESKREMQEYKRGLEKQAGIVRATARDIRREQRPVLKRARRGKPTESWRGPAPSRRFCRATTVRRIGRI